MPVHKCVGLWPWTCLPLESVWRNTYLVVSWSGEGNGTPLQCFCLENPMDGGAWYAAVHGVTKSRTWLSDFTFMHWRRKWQPTPVFLPGESQGWGSLVVSFLAVYGVAQSRTRLKRLSSSSSFHEEHYDLRQGGLPLSNALKGLVIHVFFLFMKIN